jgi:transcriptional regulator with XRE-family HTH domain
MNGGEVIAGARRRARLTQAELARHMNTTSSVVSRWERGHVEPAFTTVMAILAACEVTLSEVMDEPSATC